MEDFRSALFQVRKESQEVMDIIVRAEGLSPIEAMVLTHLSHRDGVAVGEIVSEFHLNQGNASTLCKRMERDGLLRRARRGDDERVVELTMTDAGRALVARIKANGDIVRTFVEAEAARRGVKLDEVWETISEIFLAGIAAYRRAQSKTDAPPHPDLRDSERNR